MRERLTAGELGLSSKKQRDLFPEYFLARIWKNNFGKKAVGFKAFSFQVPYLVRTLVQDREIKKVILFRENKLAAYISKLRAAQTNLWNVSPSERSGGDDPETGKIHVDLKKLFSYIRSETAFFESIRNSCSRSRQTYFEISYEQFTGKEKYSYRKELLEFLEVEADTSPLKEMFVKQSSQPLTSLISNLAEVRMALQEVNREHWLG